MNKRLVMWGTFLVVFLASVVGSYKFINKNNQDMTIELSAPTLPLVSVVVGGESYNTLHGYTDDMNISDVARYICPVGEEREIHGQIETLGAEIKNVGYEVRNNDGSRLIEAGNITWKEKASGILDFSIKMKDLIVAGEEYIFMTILQTDSHEEINYYTRFVYGNEYDLDNQLQFVWSFHNNTFDKNKVSEIATYMETDRNRDNSSLAHVDIQSSASQIVWANLPVKRVKEPDVYITYLQDNYGAYSLDYYVSSTVEDVVNYYHVVEDFLVSTYGDKLYLLDYERTADAIFQYESDVYANDKIDLSIQSRKIPVVESEDGNMAAFVVNSTLYYYDDNSNQINYVYGYFDGIDGDERSAYFEHDIKVLQVGESGSIYYIVYGYMNRGNHEGKTGVALYSYNGQTKLIEEIGFYQSARSASYIMQEIDELSFLSRQEKLYFCLDGNVVSCDVNTGATKVEIPYKEGQQLFVSKDYSCVVVDDGEDINFWQLDTGDMRKIMVSGDGDIIPQGFISNDFVYGISIEEDNVLQSDGSYAQYMKEIRIQNAEGEVRKQYRIENILITNCTIAGNQILLDRVSSVNGKITPTTQDQIVSSKSDDDYYNTIQSAMTSTYQTIQQVELKNKIDTNTLEHVKAKEIFYEGRRSIDVKTEHSKVFCRVFNPWRVVEYVEDAGEAMQKAEALEGYALDENGLIIWKKAATVSKNQIMAIELETATSERSSKNICMDIMLRQVGSPRDTKEELAQGKTCQEILANASEDYVLMDVTGSSLTSLLYYTNQDIPIMVLYDTGEAILISGFNQFNIVVMDPVNKKLGYMSRSDASEMLEETENQVFTYYRKAVN